MILARDSSANPVPGLWRVSVNLRSKRGFGRIPRRNGARFTELVVGYAGRSAHFCRGGTLLRPAVLVGCGIGRLTALWPLDPARVRIERSEDKRLKYIVSPSDGSETVTLQAADVFHLHGLGFDGVTGYSVAHLARESIGAALAAEKSGAALFGNAARPGGVLEIGGKLSDDARNYLNESWKGMFQGADKAHKTAILEEGLTFKPIAIPNNEAQWIEARALENMNPADGLDEFLQPLNIEPVEGRATGATASQD